MGAMIAAAVREVSERREKWKHASVQEVCLTFDGGLEDNPTLLSYWPELLEWFEAEVDAAGICGILDIDSSILWMLHNGIAPGQKFVVRIEQPTYIRDYWGEYDVEYGDWDIVWREPLSDNLAWRAWVGAFFDGPIRLLRLPQASLSEA